MVIARYFFLIPFTSLLPLPFSRPSLVALFRKSEHSLRVVFKRFTLWEEPYKKTEKKQIQQINHKPIKNLASGAESLNIYVFISFNICL